MKKLGRLIENVSELMVNLFQVDTYLNSDNDVDYNEITTLIKRGTDFVVYKSDSDYHFAPSRFIGYLNNNLITHLVKNNGKNGSEPTPRINRILSKSCKKDKIWEDKFLEFCQKLGVQPSNKTNRKYWILDDIHNETYCKKYYEGDVQKALVNKYERNPVARRECIEIFGYKCQVCGMDFEKKYGSIGQGYIHVHHIVPLSKIGKGYHVNPKTDLVPVCANCHAMLHRKVGGKILTIEELKSRLQ